MPLFMTRNILKWISFELKVHKFSLSSGKGIIGGKNDLSENHLFFFPAIPVKQTNFLFKKKKANKRW